ncbi:MAG: tetratricopeptide repeat-containing protein, partial [Pseudomonadota bacterium]
MADLEALAQAVITAAPDGTGDTVMAATRALCDALNGGDETEALDLGVFAPLKAHRQFEALLLLAERLNGLGHRDARVRLNLAQALIETGTPSVGIDLLMRITGKEDTKPADRIEALGLLGRGFKDLYMRSSAADTARGATLLNLSIKHYAEAFALSREMNYWTGENILGLLHKARARGIDVETPHAPDVLAGKIAGVIELKPEEERSYWDWASLSATHIARGDWEAANAALSKGLALESVTAFALAGTIRQFREIWEMEDMGDAGAGLLVALQARLLQ